MTELSLDRSAPPVRPDKDAAEASGKRQSRRARRGGWQMLLEGAVMLLILGGLAWGVRLELRSSYVQSLALSRLASGLTFKVEPGPNPAARFPSGGPYDERLGYSQLPSFIEALTANHFVVERQARLSPKLDEFASRGGYVVYPDKTSAGLTILDRDGSPMFVSRYPEHTFGGFEAVAPLVVDTLLFVEDRQLLDPGAPQRNPAIEWDRFAAAVGGRVAGLFDSRFRQGGGSTLATQIEKYRHSPSGRTGTIAEKLRQMVTASARAYLNGPDTTDARRRIVVAYLNSTPLSSRPGFGEVIGLGDGLWVWYGTDLETANRALAAPAHDAADLAAQARAYKQVLSLLLAERRPTYYLVENRKALAALTDRYLDLLGAAGVVDPALYHAALKTELRFRSDAPSPAAVPFVERKAADAVRTRLLSLLRVPSLYDLDRLDLTAETTLDARTQQRVTDLLSRLSDPKDVKALGLVGFHLLGREDPSRVTYSVVLYERGADRNDVRIQADSLDEPFDINAGAKLILGSTAKLRTVITYLEVVAELHRRYGSLSTHELEAVSARARDPLTRWAAQHLAESRDRGLRPMLDAALERRYSADPGEVFFTGGGIHVFRNFERSDDGKVLSVGDGFRQSVNLVFIRLMRDIVHYYTAEARQENQSLLAASKDTARLAYLRRFADREGSEYLNRFIDDYRGLGPDAALALLASRVRPAPHRLAAVFRSVRPDAGPAALRDFLRSRLPRQSLDDDVVARLYAKYSPDRFSLADLGFIAGVHPLELWLAGYIQTHPEVSRAEALKASAAARQDAYAWLFKTHSRHMQDVRIAILREQDAFGRILDEWRRLGYPFGQLIPSYATAIGSSGDRPEALAELMGIILNDGVRLPLARIRDMRFAANTPFETDLSLDPPAPERVLAPEVAATVRQALIGVVQHGTAQRARDAFREAGGQIIPLGGKTGTGDNRFERFAAGGRLIESRVVDRTATFVFFIGDRFFGTVTAYVPGPEAGRYHFTSALAVQLLKDLAPVLAPLLGAPARA